jgi:hypothetical protein
MLTHPFVKSLRAARLVLDQTWFLILERTLEAQFWASWWRLCLIFGSKFADFYPVKWSSRRGYFYSSYHDCSFYFFILTITIKRQIIWINF